MKRLLAWVQSVAAAIGGPGLFIIAFLDSSFLSFPQVVDLLIITMAVQEPYRMVYYASMATAGSVSGCLALYVVARRGGDAWMHSRFRPDRLVRARAFFQRHGVLAVLFMSLLPPPAPFKLFVLLAGVSAMPWRRFAVTVAIGRSIRYFGEGLLAIWYGRQVFDFLQRHGRVVAIIGLLVAAAAGTAWLLWRRRRTATF
jgi:membrane protein YqaA with SNARE-associated domain